jgi:hypothetical protein
VDLNLFLKTIALPQSQNHHTQMYRVPHELALRPNLRAGQPAQKA